MLSEVIGEVAQRGVIGLAGKQPRFGSSIRMRTGPRPRMERFGMARFWDARPRPLAGFYQRMTAHRSPPG